MRASPAFRRWARADEVLFDHGALLAADHRRDQARAAWERLLADHPGSRWAAEAHLALADAAFADADLPSAEAEYRAVIAIPGARSAAYARYKLGWVHHDQQEADLALAAWVEVARTAPDPLRREAMRDTVRAFADARAVVDALAFFDGLARGQGPVLTIRLAEHYRDQGRYLDAAFAYREAIPLLDLAAACAAAEGVAELARLAGPRPEIPAAEAALADWRLADCPPR
jgi:tetratricopeptide (TPR) repeat protein